MGNSSPPTASREHTAFPPDRAVSPIGCLDTCGNPQKSSDFSVSDEPQKFLKSSSEQALTPENCSRTVRPALRLTRGWKHGPRETRSPRDKVPAKQGPPNTRSVQSLPETVQVPRPPGIWTVPGAFFLRGGRGSIGGRRVWAYSELMTPSSPAATPEKILRWIMVAVLVWGSILAAGSWTFNHDIRRPIIVFACVIGFLGFWNVMLAARRRRLARGDAPENRR